MFFVGRPYTITSSIIDSQPFLLYNKSLIRYWKLSGADVIPNASRLKQNLPHGVINVVSLALSGCRGICQSPQDVSSLEKYRVPASLGAISSMVGSTSLEFFTALFSLLRSTQIFSLPLLFCTNTVMYQEFVVCNIAGNCITYAENSTIFYFKSVSTWQEEPTAHVRSA